MRKQEHGHVAGARGKSASGTVGAITRKEAALRRYSEAEQAVEVALFDFHGDQIEAVKTADGQWWGILEPMCDVFEISTEGQAAKLKTMPWATTKIIFVERPNGRKQAVFCINLRSIAGWLFSINPGKVAEHLREKLVRYQTECAEVLADRFLGKRGALPEGAISKEEAQRLAMRYASKMSFVEAEKRSLREEVARTKADLDRALDASSALIAERDVLRIKSERDEVARMLVRLSRSKKPNLASARLTVHNRVMSRWLGAGKRIDGMPREYVAEVLAALNVWRRELEAECKRQRLTANDQVDLFSHVHVPAASRPN